MLSGKIICLLKCSYYFYYSGERNSSELMCYQAGRNTEEQKRRWGKERGKVDRREGKGRKEEGGKKRAGEWQGRDERGEKRG